MIIVIMRITTRRARDLTNRVNLCIETSVRRGRHPYRVDYTEHPPEPPAAGA